MQIVDRFVVPRLVARYGQGRNGPIKRLWWTQDGVPARHAIPVPLRLRQLFPNHVVGLGHHVEWPPRSPDLTPCDCFPFGDT